MTRMYRRRAIRRTLGGAAALLVLHTPQLAEARGKPAKPAAPARSEAAPAAAKVAPVPARRGGSLFAVVIGPGPAWKKGQPLKKSSDGHWKYWQDLHAKGMVDSAGPVGQDTGFVLLRARNQREANAVIAADPAVRAGKFRGVARPYDPTIGN